MVHSTSKHKPVRWAVVILKMLSTPNPRGKERPVQIETEA